MADLLNNMNMDIIKVPLGFIRIVQFPLTILAFATTCGYSASFSYLAHCPDTTAARRAVHIEFGYSFSDLTDIFVPKNSCDSLTELNKTASLFHDNYGGSAKFFVFVGVISMLWVLLILATYLFLWARYENDNRLPIGDFVGTALLAFFWFISSCIWAGGAGNVKAETKKETVLKRLKVLDKACGVEGSPSCTIDDSWAYGGLTISVVLGFLCFFVFAANLWFIYKETAWFRNRIPPVAGGVPGGRKPEQGPSPSNA